MNGGDSALARSFGATVAINNQHQGLYLVIGYQQAPVHAVREAQGQVVLLIPERRSLLAVLPGATAHSILQRHPDVALAGPVTIDPTRFASFVRLAGLDGGTPSSPGPT